jgi:hypothetical protein
MDHLDRLAAKFTAMNEQVAKEHRRARIREALDQMVLNGELGHNPETGEYWTLPAFYEERATSGRM